MDPPGSFGVVIIEIGLLRAEIFEKNIRGPKLSIMAIKRGGGFAAGLNCLNLSLLLLYSCYFAVTLKPDTDQTLFQN